MVDTDLLTKQLSSHFKNSCIQIYDDAHLHTNHTQFQSQKAYLRIHIQLETAMPRLKLHREIMQLAKHYCPIEIHAIQINLI